jgi:hypothetical protein
MPKRHGQARAIIESCSRKGWATIRYHNLQAVPTLALLS